MQITLTVIDGPHKGRAFTFASHDTFLVGRSKYAHFQLLDKDKYFSRIHFLMELNPPYCRIVDLNSRNGTYVNGKKMTAQDLHNGDQITAGTTVIQLSVQQGEPAQVAQPAASGSPVHGLQIVRELGHGGLGFLHLARRLADEQLVAIKTIIPATPPSPQAADSFLRDIQALKQLDHPALVKFTDAQVWEGKILVFSAYVAGRDSGQLVTQQKPLSVREGSLLMAQLLEGLEYAHARGQVHGDIKPSNVLIRQEEGKVRACLTDFGLARIYQGSRLSGLSMTNAVMGSGAFLPPERITQYREVKPAADQYGAAATLYFWLTGQLVHDMPGELAKRLTRLVRSDLVPIQRRRADLPTPVVRVIHRALARDPGRRFPDVKAMKQALLQVVT